MGSATAIAVAIVVAVLIGAAVALSARSRKSGKLEAEHDAQIEANKQREKGDAVMAEPVADEKAWLAGARERLARMREHAKQP